MSTAREILKHTFGYDAFRHSQDEIIEQLCQGNDAFVLMPTGGGKSLCYQIPSLIRKGTGIVISPLIALMQDQVDALLQLGIRAAFVNSSQTAQQQRDTEQQLSQGQLDLLFVAPERLLSHTFRQLLQHTDIALFAIDEAHCVSQWGHDFRKDYQQLGFLATDFPEVPRIALTATADQRTRDEIIRQLDLGSATTYINSFDRANIRYHISDGQNNKQRLLQFIQDGHAGDSGIVYCLSRKKTEAIAEWLNQQGLTALPYHAGMSQQQRADNQSRFLRDEGIIIVATIAFGMGIDKPDVRFVAHLNLPKSIESYYQETGRAGRDGEPADAWMAYGLQDVITLKQMNNDNDASETFKRVSHHKLEAMLSLCEQASCRRQSLLAYFGETLEAPCGNCDNCLSPPLTWDASEASRMALSCVYRCGQRFGVSYIIDVLTGKDDERIRNNQHHQLSTFAIGGALKANEWRSVFRQLIALGYLTVDLEGYGTLRLTEKARPLLRGDASLTLRKLTRKTSSKQSKSRSDIRSVDQALFDALKARRSELARERGVPAYVIFHDKTLNEMARQRPDNNRELSKISGVGDRKRELYGDDFIAVIKQYPLPDILNNDFSDTVNETLSLHHQGVDIATIAATRQLTSSTVINHLAQAIEAGTLRCSDVVELNQQQYEEIRNALTLYYDDAAQQLKPVHDALDAEYDYDTIRCVLAQLNCQASLSTNMEPV